MALRLIWMVAFQSASMPVLVQPQSGKKIVVDFWAEWCGPCRMIAPHFARLSEEMTNWIFLKVDVDSQDTLSAECGIRAMPTFQFYDSDGKKIDELVGASIDALVRRRCPVAGLTGLSCIDAARRPAMDCLRAAHRRHPYNLALILPYSQTTKLKTL